MNEPGRLIAFEGIDGSGKTTQWKRLAARLRAGGREVVLSYEPTRNRWGRALRDAWLGGKRLPVEEEIHLFERDRREHLHTLIRPALARGAIVLLDRYYYSSAAYQGSREGQTPEAVLARFETFAPAADLMLLFDLPVTEALWRMNDSGKSPDAMEVRGNLERVARAYRSLERPEIRRIDASGPPDEVERRVWDVVRRVLP